MRNSELGQLNNAPDINVENTVVVSNASIFDVSIGENSGRIDKSIYFPESFDRVFDEFSSNGFLSQVSNSRSDLN